MAVDTAFAARRALLVQPFWWMALDGKHVRVCSCFRFVSPADAASMVFLGRAAVFACRRDTKRLSGEWFGKLGLA